MENLTTSQVAKQAQVNPETLRYYLRKGLLEEPDRTEAGYRLYPPNTVLRILFIKNAQGLGFSLKEIKSLLDLRIDSRAACSRVRGRVNQKILDVKDKIVQLRAILKTLQQMKSLCTHNKTQTGCPILECLTHVNEEASL